MKKQTRTSEGLKRTCGIAVFAALAFLVTLVIRIPVQFLTFDVKDAIICLAAFMYGPISGVIIALIAAFIELVTISGTGFYGFLMNFISSAAFAFTASFIYSRRKTLGGAIIGVYSAAAVLTAVMMGLNLIITPLYMGVERSVVASMLPTLLLPFNLAKALLNSAITLLLYKPLVIALRRAHLLPTPIAVPADSDSPKIKEESRGSFSHNRFSKKTYIPIILGVCTAVVSIVVFIILNRA